MAKQSIVAVIRAKPNERGKTSHIPIICGRKGCNNEATTISGPFNARKRECWPCHQNPPQSPKITRFRSMGLIK